MFIVDGSAIVTSPSDLKSLSDCEFAFARTLDHKLGRTPKPPEDDDPMLKAAGALGDVHEGEQLERYRSGFGAGVHEIERPEAMTRDGIRIRADQTAAALRDPAAQVVFQATFFDETDPASPTIGFADFLLRQSDGRWRVQDTKLARRAKVTALLQLAAYHEHLVRLGVAVDDEVELLLGDGTTSVHRVADIAPLYRERMQRLRQVVAERVGADGPAEWGDPGLEVDGRCVHCAEQVLAHDDVLQVAGITRAHRAKLAEVGIRTLAEFASATARPDGCSIPQRTYDGLQLQARLQHAGPDAKGLTRVEVVDASAIAHLPAASPGDLFFDFEGDPLWRDASDVAAGGVIRWNLDYLFGMVDRDERFTPIWAHDLDEERRALEEFLDLVATRRAAHPDLHIYHYASYEKTHLLSIAARHGVREHEVDELLRDGVLVDLYPVVKRALRIGVASYSIKKLEPLYMGERLRGALDMSVTTAGGSVEEYRESRRLLADGDAAGAQRLLDGIADYNAYDCVSTLGLLGWLTAVGAEHGAIPGATIPEELQRDPFEESPLAAQLRERAVAATAAGDAVGGNAFRLASAAVDFHKREAKTFWWEHFARLVDPLEDWRGQRGVFEVDSAAVERDWVLVRTRWSRELRLTGQWAPGSSMPSEGADAFALHDPPPFRKPGRAAGSRLDAAAEIIEPPTDGTSLRIIEYCPAAETPWDAVPVAVTPGKPPPADSLRTAIEEFGQAMLDDPAGRPRDAVADILHREPPVLTASAISGAGGFGLEPAPEPDRVVAATIASCRRLDHSVLAVQGPPGTGKTFLAAHVIAALVADGWAIGVVAQSHRVVENVLDGVVEAGVDPARVAKKRHDHSAPGQYDRTRWQLLPKDGYSGFRDAQAGGYVVGGTAWDFVNENRIRRRQLDLLVVDEAGQFSLANTIAVSASANNLLLLGDPQQLPQVSQGVHPAPVDQAALSYLGGGAAVLPAERGYFLAESRRMHPALSSVVSRLAYEGKLGSHPDAADRHLEGVEPGLHAEVIEHDGDATSSAAEAARVVEIVQDLLGRAWRSGSGATVSRPLGLADLIVVTPYNAQVECVREALADAGLDGVRVGTVDKFQGQEAVVSIVTLAASSAKEVPRGLPFLLSPNRLNVAISRAQWAAYLLYSPRLLDHLPHSAEEVVELSRFIALVGR